MQSLGDIFCAQGRFRDAKAIQEEALQGLRKLHGEDDRVVFEMMNDLGTTYARLYHFHKARKYNMAATEGLKRPDVLGPTHLRTLAAMESLTPIAVNIGGRFLEEVADMMQFVLDQRKEKFRNKEHPLVLLAMVSLALLKRQLGFLEEAENLILTGLPIAERNFGASHIGPLHGRYILATIRIRQQRYDEAEKILLETIERQSSLTVSRGKYHPDRIMSTISLSECYKLQGRIEDSLAACDEALLGMEDIGGQYHQMYKNAQEERKALVELLNPGNVSDSPPMERLRERPTLSRDKTSTW
ncbi:MAG: hypothetical protein Q9227_005700 [Pyrenula ochraceoflavens]